MGCHHRATVMLAFDPRTAKAWLRDLVDAHPSLGLALCGTHAERTAVPMGWERIDERRPAWQSYDTENPFGLDIDPTASPRPGTEDSSGARAASDTDSELAEWELDQFAGFDDDLEDLESLTGDEAVVVLEPTVVDEERARVRSEEERLFTTAAVDRRSRATHASASRQRIAPPLTSEAETTPAQPAPEPALFEVAELDDLDDDDFETIFGIADDGDDGEDGAEAQLLSPAFTEIDTAFADDAGSPDEAAFPGDTGSDDDADVFDAAEYARAEETEYFDYGTDDEPNIAAEHHSATAESATAESPAAESPAAESDDGYEYELGDSEFEPTQEFEVSFEDIFPTRVNVSHDDAPLPPPRIERIARVEPPTFSELAEEAVEAEPSPPLFADEDKPVAQALAFPDPDSSTPVTQTTYESASIEPEHRPTYLPSREGQTTRLQVDSSSPLLGRAFGFIQRD